LRIKELETFVVGNPPPRFGGRYFLFVKLTTDDGVTGILVPEADTAALGAASDEGGDCPRPGQSRMYEEAHRLEGPDAGRKRLMGSRHQHDDPHYHGQRLDPKERVAVVGAEVEGGDRAPASQREGALQPPRSGQAEVPAPPAGSVCPR